MTAQQAYYSVCICTLQGMQTITVYATSDYAAARQVRDMTGYMARNEHDVTQIATTAHQSDAQSGYIAAQEPQPFFPPP